MLAGPGEKVWVPFNISVPRDTTLPLELAVLTEFILDGSDRNGNDRYSPRKGGGQGDFIILTCSTAVLTLHDVRLSDEGAGINVCCLNSLVDPFIFYGPTFLRTENLTTFMQQDSLTMELGYVTNKVFAFRKDTDRPGVTSHESLLQAGLQSP